MPVGENNIAEARKQARRAITRAYGTMAKIDTVIAAEIQAIGEEHYGVEVWAEHVDNYAELSNEGAMSSLAMAYAEFNLLGETTIRDKLETMGRNKFGKAAFGDAMFDASTEKVGMPAPSHRSLRR